MKIKRMLEVEENYYGGMNDVTGTYDITDLSCEDFISKCCEGWLPQWEVSGETKSELVKLFNGEQSWLQVDFDLLYGDPTDPVSYTLTVRAEEILETYEEHLLDTLDLIDKKITELRLKFPDESNHLRFTLDMNNFTHQAEPEESTND